MNNLGIVKYRIILKQLGSYGIRQHKMPSPEELNELKQLKKKRGTVPSKEEKDLMFRIFRYWDKKKGYYQPSRQIKKALILAGAGERIPGRGKETFVKYLKSGILITSERIYHKRQKDVKLIGKWIKKPRGETVWSVKIEINNWELEPFTIENLVPEIIDETSLRMLLTKAGLFFGLGADRVALGYNYGRFEIKELKKL